MDTPETARVRRVIDGDTIELDRPDPTGNYLFERVRLMRISAPELDAKEADARTVAYNARRFLRTLLVGQEVLLYGDQQAGSARARDKFHRRLARVEVLIGGIAAPPEPHDVETLLVAAGLARWWRDVLRDRQSQLAGRHEMAHAKAGR